MHTVHYPMFGVFLFSGGGRKRKDSDIGNLVTNSLRNWNFFLNFFFVFSSPREMDRIGG